jgi:O-antigen/teichoic acid export membrane protein
LSHLLADRKYTARLSSKTLRRSWSFGAPLLLNAGLLFFTFYADRFIVAEAYGWASLALYGVALQLAMLPSQIVGRAAASLVLPDLRLALAGGDYQKTWARCLNTHLILACTIWVGFVGIAPAAIALVYGEAFRPDLLLVVALAFAAAFRVLRTPFSQLAVATGRTGDPARANLLRAAALVPAIVFAIAGLPLAAIAAAAALGEAGATIRAFQLSSTAFNRLNQKEAYV